MHALRVIENAIRRNATTGQVCRLVCFLAGVFNGLHFRSDLTELRALDTDLANACLDYLNYDRLGLPELHRHLSNGERELHRWITDDGIGRHGMPEWTTTRTDASGSTSRRDH